VRTVPVERRPAELSRLFGVGAGALAALSVAGFSFTAGAVAVLGLLVVVFGVVRGSHPSVSLGAAATIGGVLYAGLAGTPAPVVLFGVGASVVAWDLAGFSIDLGDQLGSEARTRRLEVVHATASVGVATVTAGLGYGVYTTATGGQPMAALLLLLLAGLFVVAGRLFPTREPDPSTATAGDRRRRAEIREYLRTIGEPYAEDHEVDGRRVAFRGAGQAGLTEFYVRARIDDE
jgi:hypothetical protein